MTNFGFGRLHPVRVGEDLRGREAEAGDERRDEGVEIGAERRFLAGGLALGGHRHCLPQEREERARVEAVSGARDGGVSRHGVISVDGCFVRTGIRGVSSNPVIPGPRSGARDPEPRRQQDDAEPDRLCDRPGRLWIPGSRPRRAPE